MDTPQSSLTADQLRDWARYEEIVRILQTGGTADFVALQTQEHSFPHGLDLVLERHWLTNAIDSEATKAVGWMIEQRVNLSYRDDEGFTPLMSALSCRTSENRYALLRMLLAAGARHDIVGANCWTAAHFAASDNDVEALRLLREHGADLCIATEDLGSWRTPVDVARFHRHDAALEYLNSICLGAANQMYRPHVPR